MSRLFRSAAAGVLTVVLCLGMSTGPVQADDQVPADPTATATTGPTETTPTETTPTETSTPEPTSTTPTETKPTEPGPISSTTSPATTTTEPPSSATPVAPAAELADLQLRVWFDKPSYQLTELVTAHASVTNAGTATANNVSVRSTGNLTSHRWDPFALRDVTIAPGETVEGTLTAHISTHEDAVRLVVVTESQRPGEPDANPDDNTVSASVPIITDRGNVRGSVFGDSNGNGAHDPGEALVGITLTITSGGGPNIRRTATTGANGTFLFRDLPVGQYTLHDFHDGVTRGWYLHLPTLPVDVRGPDDPAIVIRAVPEVAERLALSLVFAQQSYQLNDRAVAVLTLTNMSLVHFFGLTAECVLPNLGPEQPDVGPLTPGGNGVTLPAGETRHYPITVPITGEAVGIGHVRLYCNVGAPPVGNGRYTDTAVARVPGGGVATRVTDQLKSRSAHHGMPFPGAKVYLRDSITGAIVASAVTDANGYFTFCNLPVGPYSWGVVGPWRPENSNADFVVHAGESSSPTRWLVVVPGPEQPDVGGPSSGCGGGSPPPAAPPAAPPADSTPELAATGAGVTRLALSGLLTLLIGAGLVLIARQNPNGPGSRRT